MTRYLIIVNGRVQGVGFRYFLQITAAKLNLTGWCKNLSNDNVEVEIQGFEESISSFISEIKKGNGFAKVYDMDFKNIPLIDNEKKFTIKY
jgi:acylphosphatase